VRLSLCPGRARSLLRLLAATLAAICLNLTLASGDALARAGAKPTIVFVHGGFADASGFGAVTSRLQDRGYTVISPAAHSADPRATPPTWPAC
jgi:pimeloyl-ACP methyl ester carboxylesterase